VARGDLAAKSVQVKELDFRLARTRRAGLPQVVRVHGNARISPVHVDTAGLVVEVPGASATARGEMDLDRQLIKAGLSVVAVDLARVLGDLGLPPLAKDARLQVEVSGTPATPAATGEAVIHGLGAAGRILPELKAKFSLRDGIARIDSLSGAAFGGSLHASGQLRLYERTTRHMLRAPVVDMAIGGRDLDLAAIVGGAGAGGPALAGRVSFEGRAQGPIDLVTAELHVPSGTRIRALGEDLEIGPIDVALGGQTVEIKRLHLGRREGARSTSRAASRWRGATCRRRDPGPLAADRDRPLAAGGGDRPGPLAVWAWRAR
jgi:hypothetical protein